MAPLPANRLGSLDLPKVARGGIEPPTRGFSVLIRPYTLDQHKPYRATILGVRVVAPLSLVPAIHP